MPAADRALAPADVPPLTAARLLPAIGVALSAVLLFGLYDQPVRPGGYLLLVVSLGAAFVLDRPLFQDLLLIAIGITIVSLVSVEADISYLNILVLGTVFTLAVLVPFLIDRLVYRRRTIRFPWRSGQKWEPWERSYLISVPFLGWLILPFYFITSGVYLNWPAVEAPDEIARLFVGVNAVGTWDELFFICTCYALLLRHFRPLVANILQAIIFVSFLWELGYQAWGPALTIPFALLQGFIFTRTRSLTFVLIVHLLFDLAVFLVIVHAHNPGLLPIFLVPSP
ncbi:CPBP family intramembrane metalloprotease [Microcella daejeonensis]|uniref:CPBP family glutamic-type intramembrane protease n=1 Tax=Microcella daejeonensis TaxID=2994971 RepID=UPI00226F5DC8|nr:CPBP family glutamic-type intramembrane protease [Microcella daejeonensis]WAB83207.1 CPBP family intramembrane metalloprotease [Microcella daejeonensis]